MFLYPFFKGFFKFRYVGLVTKNLWAILDFFSQRSDLFPTCTKPKFTNNQLTYYSLKVTKFHAFNVPLNFVTRRSNLYFIEAK